MLSPNLFAIYVNDIIVKITASVPVSVIGDVDWGNARWCNGKAFWLAISRSRVQILLEATRNNLRQVVYTYVPLSPSSITWYRPKGGDALRLGR